MHSRGVRRLGLVVGAVLVVTGVAACGSGSGKKAPQTSGVAWSTVQSTGDAHGIAALVAEAQREGQLTVIGLPTAGTSFARLEAGFTAKYGIKVNALSPTASSQQQIEAVTSPPSRDTTPDVVNLDKASAYAHASLFAPYKVSGWADIPDSVKAADGTVYDLSLTCQDFQAVSRTAPHPAAARLWEEFLFSDAGQNVYLEGGGRPARTQAMTAAGTLEDVSGTAPSGSTC